eukprot:1155037-Pelagomonas_calceolata.AAC.3
MENLASKEGGEDYKTFWEAFGRNLKERPSIGVIEDTENREKLSKLLRFFSSRSEEDITSLDAYVSRMKPGQKDIFYMAADSVEVSGCMPLDCKRLPQVALSCSTTALHQHYSASSAVQRDSCHSDTHHAAWLPACLLCVCTTDGQGCA